MVIFGTYAADFNAIEYLQRLRCYLPDLERNLDVGEVHVILNAQPEACLKVAEMVDLQDRVKLYSDPKGEAGRSFGVSTGWRPDDDSLPPYFKLYMMLFGFGAWATLPAVIGGYIGNPFRGQRWVEDAMAVNCRAGRFPTNGLELSEDDQGTVLANKFAELPIVGSWPRRPLELATLRLQNMVGISFSNWSELAPTEENLNVLTQLGGCVIIDESGNDVFKWVDNGICSVLNFEKLLDEGFGSK